MRELRRKDRAMTENDAHALLLHAQYGVLSTVTKDGTPYGIPLNYCVIDGGIYFHSALDGHKIDNIEANDQVSFCVVGDTRILPGKFATSYQSVVVAGVVEEVFAADKQQALEGLLHKYYPREIEQGLVYIEKRSKQTRVFCINIHSLSGKART